MTCQRCEAIPDSVIDNYIRNERIKELNAELAILTGKPVTRSTDVGGKEWQAAARARREAEDRRMNTPA